MPSLGLAFNIVGVAPGVWLIHAAAMVNGKLQHGDISGFPKTEFHGNITMDLFDYSANAVVGAALRAPNVYGFVDFDGTVAGTWTDLSKKRYSLRMHFIKGGVVIHMERDIELGLYDINYVEPDANILLWDKWINKALRQQDAGIAWWTGFPAYAWSTAVPIEKFLCDLENHMGLATEPLWKSTAPDMNARVTMAGVTAIGIAKCPICDAVLGFTTLGEDTRCSSCGFVSTWSKKFIEPEQRINRLETYKL